jgi:uncharacterized protein YjbI with pentapeptide repeats
VTQLPDNTPPREPRLDDLAMFERHQLLADLDWDGVSLQHDFSGCDLGHLHVRGAHCSSSHFVAADLQDARLIDVVLDGCDLSGARLDEAALTRVRFQDCRLSGVQFNAAHLSDVRFVNCRLDGASFRMTRGKRVWFEQSLLSEAEFTAAELAHVRFDHCDLTTADFSQARIPDARLHGSVVDDLRGVAGLQRPVIDGTQAVPFGLLLLGVQGVVIDDGELDAEADG